MNRRAFLAEASLAAAAAALRAQTPEVTITMGAGAGATIPANFVGLSYESAQLANPAFFSAANRPLVELFRGLSPAGNLRLGGGSSEFTAWSPADPSGPPPFEVFGPDTSKTEKHGTVTTPLALRNLRAFLDATGWSCLYGLNLGQGTVSNATAEAAAVQRILGPRLLAFQIGNEPDSFRNRYRPASYTPADFLREWNTFHDAIAAAVPGARFAGPDISNKLPYLTAFAAEAPRHPDIILLTGHYYAMGPAGSSDATLDQLFELNPKLATMKAAGFAVVAEAMQTARLPFRMSEGNSCWDGGKPGVSDTLASALWCADTMLRFAQLGWSGVNWHGGGNGFYTPIAGAPSTGFTRRPEYFGIQFAQSLSGYSFVPVTLTGSPAHFNAYALIRDGQRRLVLINKDGPATVLRLPFRPTPKALTLSGPSLDSKEASLSTVRVPHAETITVPGHTAMILALEGKG